MDSAAKNVDIKTHNFRKSAFSENVISDPSVCIKLGIEETRCSLNYYQ